MICSKCKSKDIVGLIQTDSGNLIGHLPTYEFRCKKCLTEKEQVGGKRK